MQPPRTAREEGIDCTQLHSSGIHGDGLLGFRKRSPEFAYVTGVQQGGAAIAKVSGLDE